MSDAINQTIDHILYHLKHHKRPYIFLPDVDSFSIKPFETIKAQPKALEPREKVTPETSPQEIPKEKSSKVSEPPAQDLKQEKTDTAPPESQNLVSNIKAPPIEIKPYKGSPIDEMKDIKELLLKKYPKIIIYDTPLNDSKAKRIKNAWKDLLEIPATLLIYHQKQHKNFLENIAKAISSVFSGAKALPLSHIQDEETLKRILENKDLKLIITPDDVIMSSKVLMKHYKELPQQKQRFLGQTPLILLPDLSLYFKDPKLKASLWRLLCHQLSSNPV